MNDKPKVTKHIRQCNNAACSFRFPVIDYDKNFEVCPKCGHQTEKKLDFPIQKVHHQNLLPEIRISFILDNLRSVFNVGSIFRSADGCGIVKHLYLCGTTPTPDHPKMAKTALGAEKVIPWSYHPNGFILAQQLLLQENKLTALEMTDHSIPFRNYSGMDAPLDVTFIVGNEVTGIDPEILNLVTTHVHLPMHGVKESLNVAIAASILCYTL